MPAEPHVEFQILSGKLQKRWSRSRIFQSAFQKMYFFGQSENFRFKTKISRNQFHEIFMIFHEFFHDKFHEISIFDECISVLAHVEAHENHEFHVFSIFFHEVSQEIFHEKLASENLWFGSAGAARIAAASAGGESAITIALARVG